MSVRTYLGREASVLLSSLFRRGRTRRHLCGFWKSCCCVGEGFASLWIMGLVTMVRYWMRFCFRIGKRCGLSTFRSIRRSLILWSNVGNLLGRSLRTKLSCRCQLRSIVCARRLKTRSLCPKCLNIYLISY